MFERFTREARCAVIDAQESARDRHAAEIETEDLLFGLLGQRSGFTAKFLPARLPERARLAEEFDRARRRGDVTEADAEALGEFGIDIDRVVDAVERAHGERVLVPRGGEHTMRRHKFGHIPFSQDAKATLKQTLREALELGDMHIDVEHLLLALLAGRGRVPDVLGGHGITAVEVRLALRRAS